MKTTKLKHTKSKVRIIAGGKNPTVIIRVLPFLFPKNTLHLEI